ncbi:MAG: galactokinase [Pseudomonadota bacterium]
MNNFTKLLKSEHAEASVPCRIDMGGTLDISTFHYPLMHLNPCTFNIAVNLRTRVHLHPFDKGKIKVSSRGFKSAVFPIEKAPFNHPLGLMFAIASFFRADGVHISINSSSPPRSALGGSSSAAVALIAVLSRLQAKTGKKPLSKQQIVLLAHSIEQSVAGVPCGLQDQLAAAFGGINAWYWKDGSDGAPYKKRSIFNKKFFKDFKKNLLLAYCGIPHESKNINSIWVNQFVSGKYRNLWDEIVACTNSFVDALSNYKFHDAALLMNKETAIRKKMTPDVLDDIGRKLAKAAVSNNCGARFTGAGGGGCIWAIGEISDIEKLKPKWESVLSQRKEACLLDIEPDPEGLLIN